MGTPEFPNLGKHCSVDDCHLIDFLPFTCDYCHRMYSHFVPTSRKCLLSVKVYCLDHRSYNTHQCPKANKNDVTVVICPLCAKGVRLIPEENPNITWESHVNIECDPSNYEKATKKRKCPVPGCREQLTFSNTIKCRDCTIDHCLKHRFGPDHKCPGPKKPETSFPFINFLSGSRNDRSSKAPVASSSKWSTSFLKAASSVRASAEAGIAKLSGSNEGTQNRNYGGSVSGQVEACPRCNLRFGSVGALVDHVEKVHERNGIMKATLDGCPKCSKGFRDPGCPGRACGEGTSWCI